MLILPRNEMNRKIIEYNFFGTMSRHDNQVCGQYAALNFMYAIV